MSRAWRKVRGTREVWRNRSLAREEIVHSVLVAIGVRREGRKALLAVQPMAGESMAAW